MGRLLCAGRAHCGGVSVGGAAAEDALAESEAPLAPRVVRLGGRTVRTVRTGCQLLLTLARRQLRRSPRSLAPRVRQDAAVLPANPGRRSDSDTFVPRISWYKCVHICTTHFFSSLFLGGYWTFPTIKLRNNFEITGSLKITWKN